MGHARQWIEQCETKHPSCQNKTTASFTPTRLIDVGEKKIFQSLTRPVLRRREDIPPGSSYLTLSHCWGGTVPLRLMLNNMVDMMSQIPFTQLPKTFQDAIVVTQNLGLRYIWIDSLCIIQDDEDDWRHEAALMADVYKHGTCNLSASSAPNGLAGFFLDHEPILTKPVRAPFQTNRNNGTVSHDFWPEGVLRFFETGPLLSRGWVVQERLLSRRNIHFSKDQVVWECRCSSACEMFPASAPFKETLLFLKHRFSRVVWGGEEGLQSLRDVWSILVSEYTRCKLTKASDKLIAFGGIASTFTGPLGRRYVAGLWLDNVVYQLCWEGRRGKSQDYIAPSWS
ncbi:HET-domain-containing protein, partial [Sarocladium strictum]